MADTHTEFNARTRRTPVQERSRSRVQDILAATGQLLGEGGIDAVTTRALAERAAVSVAAIYQYFPNRDAIVDAYLEQATRQVDADVVQAVSRLPIVSLRSVLEAAVLAHMRFYEQNADLVRVWLTARDDSVMLCNARERNSALGHSLRDAFLAAGFLRDDLPDFGTELIVEVCTSVIEFAFRTPRSAEERDAIVRMGIEMVLSQLEMYMTARAIEGVSAEEFAAALSRGALA
jgi:AcrR family transcriptional regulator